MPKTKKGAKILRAMVETYGKKKAERVLYASANKGTITGIDRKKRSINKAKAKK